MNGLRVGVAGLGRMGRAMASRLAERGLRVSGWNRSKVDPAAFDAVGIAICDDLAGLASASDIIVLSLFDDAAVTSVVRGLCAAELRGRLLVDTSTVSPETLRSERGAISRAGASALDAPISGGPELVREGAAGFYIGGEPADVSRFMPLAEMLAARILVMGGSGTGAAAKAVNNMMLLGYWQCLKEALQVGRAAGLTLDAMLDLLAHSPAASGAFTQRLPVLRGQSDAVGFSVDGAVKDAALFSDLATRLGVQVPALEAALASLSRHAQEGHGGSDLVDMVRAAAID